MAASTQTFQDAAGAQESLILRCPAGARRTRRVHRDRNSAVKLRQRAFGSAPSLVRDGSFAAAAGETNPRCACFARSLSVLFNVWGHPMREVGEYRAARRSGEPDTDVLEGRPKRRRFSEERSPARERAPGFNNDRQHGRRSAVHRADAAWRDGASARYDVGRQDGEFKPAVGSILRRCRCEPGAWLQMRRLFLASRQFWCDVVRGQPVQPVALCCLLDVGTLSSA
ncbi:hypothetical protein IE4771_PD00030 (plasmid) [Rhizobium etli bv. mimosae str. IE4771]|uniref:Uncharacterized protein n=1 Tax=Rhizobium etli bv. mimosae str. IE4771 TaxID=1432050 RepID=A0A060IF40_RHIET|nr:hypothetical protein IE4771_PD00030 [Rhizobium sp. IE4771]